MKSIVIIGCYFGKLRIDTPIFLNSIKCNSTINWIFFTDSTWGNVPENVQVVTMTFNALKDYIQSLFDFPISLSAPYKLCDFRPAYGYIFEQYIKQYDFWGHCDYDMIFGNLREFFSEEKLGKYERIYYQGHLSIYKNNDKINHLYTSTCGKLYYKKVFSSDENCVFDEVNGMYFICKNENIKFYTEIEYADIYPYLNLMLHPRKEYNISKWYPQNYRYQIFGYKDGRIYKWFKANKKDKIKVEEYAYIHFSHKILEPLKQTDNFYITKNGLSPIEDEGIIPFEKYYYGLDEFRMNIVEIIYRIKRKIYKICRWEKENVRKPKY